MLMIKVAIISMLVLGAVLLFVGMSFAFNNSFNKQHESRVENINDFQMDWLMNSLEMQLTNKRIEEQVSFEVQYPQGLNKFDDTALDIFANNGIQIPVEIMEKLSYNDTKSTEEAIKFINIQRQNMIKELQMKLV